MMYTDLQAQPIATKKSMCDEMMKCSYIFEGKVISSKYYTIKSGEKPESYTSYLVKVNKVVKGNISNGTINIIIPNGVISSDGYISIPNEGLYCCSEDSPVKDSSTINTNSKSLEYYCGDSMFNGELKDDANDNLHIYFSSIADFYAYIKANYGIGVSTR